MTPRPTTHQIRRKTAPTHEQQGFPKIVRFAAFAGIRTDYLTSGRQLALHPHYTQNASAGVLKVMAWLRQQHTLPEIGAAERSPISVVI